MGTLPRRPGAPTTSHQLLVHRSGPGPAAHIASFVSVALLRGEAAVVIAVPATSAAAADHLHRTGVDVPAARAGGRYVELDAAATLDCLREGTEGVREDRFLALVGPLLTDLTERFGAVTVYGEMVALLAGEGDVAGVLRLERLWDPLTRTTPLRLLCGYPHEVLQGSGVGGPEQVQQLHDTTVDLVESTWALDLPGDAGASLVARAAVARLWRGWGVGSRGWVDDAELLVAELVGNAVRHGGSRPTLSVDRRGDSITLSVTDASRELPVQRDDLLAENGRGYLIIDALSDAWGVERLPTGKRVWARLVHP